MSTKSPPPANRGKTKSPTKEHSKLQSAAPIRLKTVVRRLPPNLPEPVFWQSVQPWVTDETASWKIFYQGKLRKKLNKENISSRAYVLFKHEEDLAAFSRDYDGHVFRDKQGVESQAVVEYALNQKAPPEKKKIDSRHATIQQDEDYLSFIASLQDPPAKPVDVDVDALLASTVAPEEPKTTPLLAALREQKQSAQEKKLAAAETGKNHSRKGGAASASSQKQEAVDTAPPPGRKKKGKAAQAGAAAPTPPAATPNPPTTKPSREGKHNRANANANQTPGASSSATAQSSSTTLSSKEAVPADGADPSQRRSRPMLGLQSRHLKVALSGAGVGVPAAPAPSSSPSIVPTAALASPAPGSSGTGPGTVGPSGGGSRGSRGRGAPEKREGGAKDSGGGRGSSKEKARSRHGHAGPGTRGPDATPRILSRQDPPPSSFGVGEPPAKDRAPSVGSQESGGGRGRGSRRGRGQS